MITKLPSDLSIIIVNYYSECSLRHGLDSIEAEATPVEVLVVDNGSDHVAREDLVRRHPGVTWVNSPRNVGFGKGSNLGASIARGDRLLFLNPDATIAPLALGHLIRILDEPVVGSGIVGCCLLNNDGTPQLSCRRFPAWHTALANRYSLLTRWFPNNPWSCRYLLSDFDHMSRRRVDWVSGAAMAMRRSTFQLLSGFDSSFFLYCEDVDLCKRAAQLGIETWFYPEVKVTHTIGASSAVALLTATAHRHVSIWRYYRRHLRVAVLDPLVATFLFLRFVLTALTSTLRAER